MPSGWRYSIAFLFFLLWLLVCVIRLESRDDTGILQSRHLFLAVPDPSGKVSDLFFDSRLRLGRELVSTAARDSLGSSFQHAVVRSINDKNAQLQNQLENLVREGSYCLHVKALNFRSVTLRSCSVDSEINLLSSKLSGDFFEKPLGSHFSDSSVTTSVLSLYRPRTRLGSGRRKNRDLQETSRERDEEYQKLKGLWSLDHLRVW